MARSHSRPGSFPPSFPRSPQSNLRKEAGNGWNNTEGCRWKEWEFSFWIKKRKSLDLFREEEEEWLNMEMGTIEFLERVWWRVVEGERRKHWEESWKRGWTRGSRRRRKWRVEIWRVHRSLNLKWIVDNVRKQQKIVPLVTPALENEERIVREGFIPKGVLRLDSDFNLAPCIQNQMLEPYPLVWCRLVLWTHGSRKHLSLPVWI